MSLKRCPQQSHANTEWRKALAVPVFQCTIGLLDLSPVQLKRTACHFHVSPPALHFPLLTDLRSCGFHWELSCVSSYYPPLTVLNFSLKLRADESAFDSKVLKEEHGTCYGSSGPGRGSCKKAMSNNSTSFLRLISVAKPFSHWDAAQIARIGI